MIWRSTFAGLPPPRIFFDFNGDSQVLVNWLTGIACCKKHRAQQLVATGMDALFQIFSDHTAWPAQEGSNWFRHVFREANRLADGAAERTFESRQRYSFTKPLTAEPTDWHHLRIRGSFDGARRGDPAAAGCAVEILATVGCQIWKQTGRCIPKATAVRA